MKTYFFLLAHFTNLSRTFYLYMHAKFPIMEDLLKINEDQMRLGYIKDAHSSFGIRGKTLKRSIE